MWQIQRHYPDPPSRKGSLPSYWDGSWLTASSVSNVGAKATLRSEWPQSIDEQGRGIETWPFPPKNDLEPTGDLALGPTETVSRAGGVLTTMPASPHFLTGATRPPNLMHA